MCAALLLAALAAFSAQAKTPRLASAFGPQSMAPHALATGEADFVIDPPFQDAARLQPDKRLKFASTGDIGTQFLGFDQARTELENE